MSEEYDVHQEILKELQAIREELKTLNSRWPYVPFAPVAPPPEEPPTLTGIGGGHWT